jgi:hypothetical protein
MDEDEWDRFVEHLADARGSLLAAHMIMDGIEGWLPANEETAGAVLSLIDALYKGEARERGLEDDTPPWR